MIAAYSEVVPGSVLGRADNADEYFLWALFTPCQVAAGGDTVDVPAGSVVIVPPGQSSIRFASEGSVWRGFTSLNADLRDKAPNSREYAGTRRVSRRSSRGRCRRTGTRSVSTASTTPRRAGRTATCTAQR
jgi:hypothetical protein